MANYWHSVIKTVFDWYALCAHTTTTEVVVQSTCVQPWHLIIMPAHVCCRQNTTRETPATVCQVSGDDSSQCQRRQRILEELYVSTHMYICNARCLACTSIPTVCTTDHRAVAHCTSSACAVHQRSVFPPCTSRPRHMLPGGRSLQLLQQPLTFVTELINSLPSYR